MKDIQILLSCLFMIIAMTIILFVSDIVPLLFLSYILFFTIFATCLATGFLIIIWLLPKDTKQRRGVFTSPR